jgi:transposase
MKKKRTYQASRVQQVQVAELLPVLVAGCIIALDVAKQRFAVAIATMAGEIVKLFRFDHPTETRDFLRVVEALRAGLDAGRVKAAMEPTGTYGDAVRLQLTRAGVPVHMVSPKRTHDAQEVFDGVPSLHDPKSAVLVAKLCAEGLSKPWSEPPATRVRLRALVDLRQHEQRREEMSFGELEGVLARHWPEFGRWMDVREQHSALRLLSAYPSPARVAQEPDEAKSLLRKASRSRLSEQAVAGVIADAGATLGVPMVPEQEQLVRTLAMQLIEAGKSTDVLDEQMRELAMDDEVFARLSSWMGVYTAAVIVTRVDPRQYTSARQLEKACGLNLREKSSGETGRHGPRLTITKRGPGLVRKVLYLFALRMLQESPAVRAWYKRRRGYSDDSKQRAVLAVMRKLVRALFHVARGGTFDAGKLFDLRRLGLEAAATPSAAATPKDTVTASAAATPNDTATPAAAAKPKPAAARTTPRAIARGRKRARPTSAVGASA